MIFGASFAMYFTFINRDPNNAPLARSIGLSIILLSNVLLVQVNSSDSEFAIKTFIRQIKDKVSWAVIIGTLAGLFVMLYTPLNGFLKLAPLSIDQLLIAVGVACAAVLWYELVKAFKHILRRKNYGIQ